MSQARISPGSSALAGIVLLLLLAHYSRERRRDRSLPEPEEYRGEPRTDSWWSPLHAKLVAEADKGWDVILYGDSITEASFTFRPTSLFSFNRFGLILQAWRGTSGDVEYDPYVTTNKKIFEETFNGMKLSGRRRPVRARAFGLAGDRTQHLLWRLFNGELNVQKPPAVAVVLIGTNDLGWARIRAEGEGEEENIQAAIPSVTKHILMIIRRFHDAAPATRVLLVGALPRGGGGSDGASAMAQPSLYTPSLEELNAHMKVYSTQDGRVGYVDCTDAFLTPDGGALDHMKMPDGLHPVGEGARALADCIAPKVREMLASASKTEMRHH
jgi:lysophospholipase L1-like esterase